MDEQARDSLDAPITLELHSLPVSGSELKTWKIFKTDNFHHLTGWLTNHIKPMGPIFIHAYRYNIYIYPLYIYIYIHMYIQTFARG